jgi:hypothetical protein
MQIPQAAVPLPQQREGKRPQEVDLVGCCIKQTSCDGFAPRFRGERTRTKKLAWTTGSMLSAAKPNKESKDYATNEQGE